MINLLPEENKRNIRAARTNIILLRYNFITLAAVGLLFSFCGIFYFILSSNQASAHDRSQQNESMAASYSEVKQKAEAYRSDLQTAKIILDREVNYTNVVFEITKLLPSGVILDGINLTAADFGKQISFSSHAKSYDHVIELKEKLQKSTLFSNVYFQDIVNTTTGSNETKSPYPIAVTVSAQLNNAQEKDK